MTAELRSSATVRDAITTTESLRFAMTLKTDIGLMIEDFILYTRLGLTDDALQMIREVLWKHILFFPVLAEVMLFLLLEDRIHDLCSIVTLFREEARLSTYNTEQRQYIRCFDALLQQDEMFDVNTNLKDISIAKRTSISQSLAQVIQRTSPIQELCENSYLWEAIVVFNMLCTKAARTSENRIRQMLPNIHSIYLRVSRDAGTENVATVDYPDLELFANPLLCSLLADIALLPILAVANRYDLSFYGMELTSLIEITRTRLLMLLQLVPNTIPRGNYWQILQDCSIPSKPASTISDTSMLSRTGETGVSANTSVTHLTAYSTAQTGLMSRPTRRQSLELEESFSFAEQPISAAMGGSQSGLEPKIATITSRLAKRPSIVGTASADMTLASTDQILQASQRNQKMAEFVADETPIDIRKWSSAIESRKIVVIGSVSEEEMWLVNSQLDRSSTTTAMARYKAFGGRGGLTAISLFRALHDAPGDPGTSHISVQLIAAVTDATNRERFCKWLGDNGVTTDMVEIVNSEDEISVGPLTQDYSISTTEADSGKTHAIVHLGTSDQWPLDRFDVIEQICGPSGADLVIVTMELRRRVVEQIIETCATAAIDVMLVASPGEPITFDTYERIQHLICTKSDAARMLGYRYNEMTSQTLGEACRTFLNRGVRNVVITKETEDVYFGTNDTVNVMSTSNEGTDHSSIGSHGGVAAFTGAYAAEYVRDKSAWLLETCVKRGLKAVTIYDPMQDSMNNFAWHNEIDESEVRIEIQPYGSFVERSKREKQGKTKRLFKRAILANIEE